MFNYDDKLIPNNESRMLFDEIMSNFYNKNYRSCIVNLNSLVYYDLVKKLEELRDNYNDEKSKNILEKINIQTSSEEQYSKSEKKLLELCKERNFFDNHFYELLLNLREIRNHCAHPAFYDDGLFIPDELEVKMYIEIIYKNLLVLYPINYYGATDYILEDIKNAYDKNISNNSGSLIKRAKRMFQKLDFKNKQKVFNSLFELSIIKNTDDSKKYRDITYTYLLCLSELLNKSDDKIAKDIVRKINISHLDEQYFYGNPYIARMITDKIVSLSDIKKFNPEIYDLYIDFLCDSDELINTYEQIFDSFDDYIDYLLSDKGSFYKISVSLDNIKLTHQKPYLYKLLKKMIELTPTYNGFDKADYCINIFVNDINQLSNEERDELFILMYKNDQFFNSKKNNEQKNKQSIEDIYGMEFDKIYDEVYKFPF